MHTKIHSYSLAAWLTLAGGIVLSLVSSIVHAQEDFSFCIGQAYGTAGCPIFEESSTSDPALCGNKVLDDGEECDEGVFNGTPIGDCSTDCKREYCGDGIVNRLDEECDDFEVAKFYILDPSTNELTTDERYIEATCGHICSVPMCDGNGNCSGGCQNVFAQACQEEPDTEPEVFVEEQSPAEPEPESIEPVITAPIPTSEPETTAEPAATNDESTVAESPAPQVFVPQPPAAPSTPPQASQSSEPVCGNAVVEAPEECDDGNQNTFDSCPNDCRFAVCPDGVHEGQEQCDDGNLVNADACPNNCILPVCGNGVREGAEQCDDGNQIQADGCSTTCILQACGDGVIQTGEECDDGNQDNSDSCSTLCTETICGDGFVQTHEECDDGNRDNGDTCTNVCTVARCGDGIVQFTEECDDANDNSLDNCPIDCFLPFCGDGVVEGFELCDDGNDSNEDDCLNTCIFPICGNGIVEGQELCDDGNLLDEDGCSSFCRHESPCGNGIKDANEQCDNGEENSNEIPNACRLDCTDPVCGDGVKDFDEECDTGLGDSDAAIAQCRPNCTVIRCGDGIVDPGEECDGQDDCSLNCTLLLHASAGDDTVGGVSTDPKNIIFALAFITFLAGVAYALYTRNNHKAAKKALQTAAKLTLDDVPLNELEMPWAQLGEITESLVNDALLEEPMISFIGNI